MLDARRRELPDRPGEVVDDGVHDLPRLEREARLAGVVDLLRPNDDDLRAVELLRELRRLQAQQLVERQVDELRHPRRRELPARREVGQERVVDPGAELAALLDDGEARRRAGLSAAMPIGRDARQRADGGRARDDLGGLRQALGELDAHLVAHRVDEEVGDGLRAGPTTTSL